MQNAVDFNPEDWTRKSLGRFSFSSEGAFASLDEPFVLLPWNLSFPGSAIPNILAKVEFLASQGKFPLKLAVLPFNDTPLGLRAMIDVVQSLPTASASPGAPNRIFFTRAFSAHASSYLAMRCRRVWIDATDPEWLWTTRRLQSMGLSVNFIANRSNQLTSDYASKAFSADEAFDIQGVDIYNGLHWRGGTLSVRMLFALAAAVCRDQDAPYKAVEGPTDVAPTLATFMRQLLGDADDLSIGSVEPAGE